MQQRRILPPAQHPQSIPQPHGAQHRGCDRRAEQQCQRGRTYLKRGGMRAKMLRLRCLIPLLGAMLLFSAHGGNAHTTEMRIGDTLENRRAVVKILQSVVPEISTNDLFQGKAAETADRGIRILAASEKPDWMIYKKDIINVSAIINSFCNPKTANEKLLSNLVSVSTKNAIRAGGKDSNVAIPLITDELNSIICQPSAQLQISLGDAPGGERVKRYMNAKADSEDGRRLRRLLVEQVFPGAVRTMQSDAIVLRITYYGSKPANFDGIMSRFNPQMVERFGTNLIVKQYSYDL